MNISSVKKHRISDEYKAFVEFMEWDISDCACYTFKDGFSLLKNGKKIISYFYNYGVLKNLICIEYNGDSMRYVYNDVKYTTYSLLFTELFSVIESVSIFICSCTNPVICLPNNFIRFYWYI